MRKNPGIFFSLTGAEGAVGDAGSRERDRERDFFLEDDEGFAGCCGPGT